MRKHRIVALVLVAAFLAGCASIGVKPMSATGLATVTLSTYYTQAKQTEAMSKRTDLTDAQKDMVRKKKALILRVDPKIKAYGKLIAAGGIPTSGDVQEISNIIDELVMLGSN